MAPKLKSLENDDKLKDLKELRRIKPKKKVNKLTKTQSDLTCTCERALAFNLSYPFCYCNPWASFNNDLFQRPTRHEQTILDKQLILTSMYIM